MPPSQMIKWIPPIAYLLGAILALPRISPKSLWRLVTGISLTVFVFVAGTTTVMATRISAGAEAAEAIMLMLVTLLGAIVTRYSAQYLEGESGQRRYVASLLSTLAAVTIVVAADNLLILAAAWTLTSLGLHQLLTFYSDRPPALTAAHKKFIASRVAEACLMTAILLLFSTFGTVSIAEISERSRTLPTLAAHLQLAAALLVVAVIFKSAQLPVHGWLMQVMEAPTPVSALLHAGVINLGGFVLIKLSPLISASPIAAGMLVIVGSLTAVVAGLVMMTRISIKVRLAWSTCAQMGFMLMECGLGLYDLALLHLVAHSLYKAHAFLTAGETVAESKRVWQPPTLPERDAFIGIVVRLLSLPIAIVIVALSALGWQKAISSPPLGMVVVFLVGLGIAPLLWRAEFRSRGDLGRGVASCVIVANTYLGWHFVFAEILPLPSSSPSIVSVAWIITLFLLLYALQTWLTIWPATPLARSLYPMVYGGFYLDEYFTLLTFRVWPLRKKKLLGPSSLSTPVLTPFPVISGENA